MEPVEQRAQIVQALDEARAKLRQIIDEMDTDKEIFPGWTVKHFLAHLTGWDDAVTVSLHAHANGNEPATPAVRGIDYYNAQSVAERASLDLRHIQQEWEMARAQLKTALADLSEQKYHEVLLWPWGHTGSVRDLVYVLIDHEHEHANEIKAKTQVASNQVEPRQP